MSEQNKKVTYWTIEPLGSKPAHIDALVIHPDGSIGKIVEGTSKVSYGGKLAACVGDKVECPGHSGVIIQGARSVSIGGKSLAREGDKTSCGGKIVNAFETISVFDRARTMKGQVTEESTKEIRLSLAQSKYFDDKNYIGMPYVLYFNNGEVDKGVTDDSGEILLKLKEDVESIKVVLNNTESYLVKITES